MQQIQSIKRPTQRAQRNLHNLIENTQSLVGDESDWVREGSDLAALDRGPEYSWLNTFTEDLISKISWKATLVSVRPSAQGLSAYLCTSLPHSATTTPFMPSVSDSSQQYLFRTKEQRTKSGNENVRLTSRDRFDILVRIVLTFVAAVLLIVPVAVLFKLQPTSRADFPRKTNYQLLTVFFFTMLFSTSCSVFTRARRQEVFGATAAYSAVLVVFLGNASNVIATGYNGWDWEDSYSSVYI